MVLSPAKFKGELDGFDASEENLQFVCELTAEADAALFGRISYQLLNGYWPNGKNLPNASKGTVSYSTWYNDAQKIVISKTLAQERLGNTIFISDDIANAIIDIKSQQEKDILIFGSPCVSQLLIQRNLIDSIWYLLTRLSSARAYLCSQRFGRQNNIETCRNKAICQWRNWAAICCAKMSWAGCGKGKQLIKKLL